MNIKLYKKLLAVYAAMLLLLALLRALFVLRHYPESAATADLLRTFGIGVVIDSCVASFIVLGAYLFGIFLGKKTMVALLSLFSVLTISVNFVDVFYYDHYATRLDYSVVRLFFENPSVNFKMLVHAYPIVWLLVGFVVLLALAVFVLWRFFKEVDVTLKRWTTLPLVLLTFFGLSFLYYGPPFWRLTTHSSFTALNQAASNGIYTFVKSADNARAFRKSLFPFDDEQVRKDMDANVAVSFTEGEEKVVSDIPTLRHRIVNGEGSCHKNIVIIISESFSATETGVLGQDTRSYSPYFDTLSDEGVLFTRCFSNGPRTHIGLVSTLSSFPAVIGNSLIRRRGTNKFFTIADALKKEGYETNFIFGGDVTYDDMDDYLRQGNFSNIFNVSDFSTWRFKNEWGVCDEDMFDFAFEKIKEAENPHLSVILTMSNHAPHDIPPYFADSHPEIQGFEKSKAAFYYADYALHTFMEKMKALPDYDNTLILFLADHGEVYSDHDPQFRLFHIPALLLNSSIVQQRFDKVCTQIDFLPTIFAELGYQDPYPCMGQNLFAGDYQPFAIMKGYSEERFCYSDGEFFSWNAETNASLSCRLLDNYTLTPTDGKVDEVKLSKLKSYLAFLSYVYNKGLYH